MILNVLLVLFTANFLNAFEINLTDTQVYSVNDGKGLNKVTQIIIERENNSVMPGVTIKTQNASYVISWPDVDESIANKAVVNLISLLSNGDIIVLPLPREKKISGDASNSLPGLKAEPLKYYAGCEVKLQNALNAGGGVVFQRPTEYNICEFNNSKNPW